MRRSLCQYLALAIAVAVLSPHPVRADAMLSNFGYPHEVQSHVFQSQGRTLSMAYMDIKPARPNGKTVVLLHGKNFCGATWDGVISAITEAGYRAVVPDQIGFCKSDKPLNYVYGMHELAANTHELLRVLKIERPIIAGHSMGGMLAMRYALSFPGALSGLVLINPIGLEDWRAKGVPERTLDELLASERKTDAARIKAYQQAVYYDGKWKPAYDRWVDMLASMYEGADRETVVHAQALASRMIFSDPVIHEIERIGVPVALLVGEKDTTAIGRDRVPPDLAAKLGNYPELAQAAAERFKAGAWLETWADLGHSPHIEAPDRFNALLLDVLEKY